MVSKIKSIKAKEILDSRGNPTIEVELVSDDGLFKASVPSGASTGIYEAIELRDGDKNRYNGKGVLKAIHNVEKVIAPKLIGKDCSKQKEIDELMIKLDGTKNKSKLGANAILSISMAACRAGAASKKIPLYEYIGKLSGNSKMILPVPSFNIINGGRHAKNKLSFQEFMILPIGAKNFSEAMKIGRITYTRLKNIIEQRYGDLNIGDEGGFAPNLNSNKEALDLINEVIESCNYKNKVKIGIDAAASEFFVKASSKSKDFEGSKEYNFIFNESSEGIKNSEKMIEIYEKIIKDYDVISIEDPLEQDDFEGYAKLMKKIGKKVQIVGDDLLVTNKERIQKAIKEKLCNALLLKINQIGTISEAIDSYKTAKKAGWKVMVSHRSGETNDNFIGDLAVGLGCGEIKSGAPFTIYRLAKYDRIEDIEKELGKKVVYFGKDILK